MILVVLFYHIFRNGQDYSILSFRIFLAFQTEYPNAMMPIGLTCAGNPRIFETLSSSKIIIFACNLVQV